MSTSEARRIVIAVMVVVAGVVMWDSITKHGKPLPPFKDTVALVVLAAGLLVAVEVVPAFAGPLALLFGLAIAVSRLPAGKSKFFSTYAQPETPGGTVYRPNPIPGRGD